MTNIILDERAYAECALKSLTLGAKPAETLNRVARYYYSEGYKKKEIIGLLEDFMLKCDPSINIVRWQTVIDRQASFSDRYELINIQGINITKHEIEKIKELDGRLLQRLLFTMLCLAKYSNSVNPKNNGWVNRKDNEIFSLANISITNKRKSLMINDLWRLGFIGYSRIVDNININVKIIDDDSPTELIISDFRNLGNQYLRYRGEKYIECQCCGIVVKQGGNVQKYCRDCAVEINRQRSLENWKRNKSYLLS